MSWLVPASVFCDPSGIAGRSRASCAFLRGGEFVRTPKSGSTEDTARASSYQLVRNQMWLAELALGIYSGVSFIVYFKDYHRAFSFFLLIYAISFLIIGWRSRPQRAATPAVQPVSATSMLAVEARHVESPTGG